LKSARQNLAEPAPSLRDQAGLTADSPVTDNALTRLVGYHLKRTFNLIHSDLTIALEPFELRMISFTVLTMLAENPGLRQSRLGLALNIEKPNMVALLDGLEQRELIIRHPDPTDRRAWQLFLTPAGEDLQRRSYEAVRQHEAQFLTALSGGDVDELIAMLTTIKTAVQPPISNAISSPSKAKAR
jgi:DNA-binding MarR family transcriptional regulator